MDESLQKETGGAMLFNSLAFAVFLPIVFFIYWALPHKYRYILLFLASYYFYMSWNAKYVVLILFTTFVSYVSGLLLNEKQFQQKRKILLSLTLVASLGILFFFKYSNLFLSTLNTVCERFAIPLHPVALQFMLPVGISFYTFQTLSYVIDVYKGKVEPERNFVKYAAFIAFFPQLVAGPIERTENLLPQIRKEQFFSYKKASYGLKLMAWGFFKKLVIADTVGIYVDQIYSESHYYKGFSLFLATLFFAIQIYCDFSGYSDIAIGCGKLFGIDLMRNFKSPYFARSLKEFWSRWHISLSTWFRDYVYIPLGGNRVSPMRKHWNLIVTFLASGLWHGANYTFLLWGLFHGVGQVLEKILGKWLGKFQNRVLTFFLVVIGWIFFRADTIAEAFYVLGHMWVGISSPVSYVVNGIRDFHMTALDGVSVVVPVVLLVVYDYVALKADPLDGISGLPVKVRWAVYYGFMLFFLLFASFNAREFVYFQF
ncbi:MAG: MBOAT family protein [Roseburia sp.]|nr:MBOAT family protein [Roseburia sp.]MCM1277492.1 MBOAT family protein [Robinsoniella sp.]